MMTPEILAPAGSADAVTAAVRCGAAAVYLGGGNFNARRNADNFDDTALIQAVSFCHARGVRVYLTLNTLVRESEMDDAVFFAKWAVSHGVDALIVQDVGLARYLHTVMPDVSLHASTQLSCHTPDGVKFLRDNGFCRVVLAREMSRDEIAACAGLGCELEVFVHGALCMCMSGQCYFSAALGGRSGNRGLCAQPCRLPFSAIGTPDDTHGYALSLKDNSLVQAVSDLKALGVTSFKIEGRMKRPEYVAAATAVFWAALKGETLPPNALEDLEAVFSRSGFTNGYYTARRGAAMFGTRRHEDVVAAAPILKKLANTYTKENGQIPVKLHLTAAIGEPTTLLASDSDGHTVCVSNTPAEAARTAPTTAEKAIAQLVKSGDTPYAVTATVTLGDNVMLPMSVLNALRREVLEKLTLARVTVIPPTFTDATPPTCESDKTDFSRIIRLSDAAQYSDALHGETVVVPLSTDVATVAALCAHSTIGVEIPRGLFGNTAHMEKALHTAKAAGARYALCGNINAIPMAKRAGLAVIGGFGMNVTNHVALDFYRENGVTAMLLSPELSLPQMRFEGGLPKGVFAYGRLPLMLTRNCPRKAAGADCRICDKRGVLRDRRGTDFPVICENGVAELLNSVPTYLADKQQEIPRDMFVYLHFTVETADEVADILYRFDVGATSDAPFTRGMYKNGVE